MRARRRGSIVIISATNGNETALPKSSPRLPRTESAELAAARQKIRDLEEENKILRKAAAAVREVVPQKSGTASWPSSTMTRVAALGACPDAVLLNEAGDIKKGTAPAGTGTVIAAVTGLHRLGAY